MRKRTLLATAFLLLSSASAGAEEMTNYLYISLIYVDGRPSVTHYFTAVATPEGTVEVGWGAASCPNAENVYTRDLDGQKDALAAALAAAAAGKKVRFLGTCDADGHYFHATGIFVKQ
jgi:hypothetical protein